MVLFFAALVYYRAAVRGADLAPLFVLLLYLFRIMTELFNLQTAWQQFFSFTGSVDVVEQTLAGAAAQEERRGGAPFDGLGEGLACEELTFSFDGRRTVLDAINLKIPRRSTVALVGESGSGKSTLVDLLTATLKPTAGKVTADGRSLADLDVESLRRRIIGFVSQESVTFDYTVANNITLWEGGDPAAVRLAAERAHCAEFIERMPGAYDAVIGDRGVKLSGGQRQRLAIARELYKEPEILILDEATSALDSESEQAIQASIDGLKGKMARSSSSRTDCRRSGAPTASSCWKVAGSVEEGAYQELLARQGSRFRRMCELQQLTDTAGA